MLPNIQKYVSLDTCNITRKLLSWRWLLLNTWQTSDHMHTRSLHKTDKKDAAADDIAYDETEERAKLSEIFRSIKFTNIFQK